MAEKAARSYIMKKFLLILISAISLLIGLACFGRIIWMMINTATIYQHMQVSVIGIAMILLSIHCEKRTRKQDKS